MRFGDEGEEEEEDDEEMQLFRSALITRQIN